VKLFFFFFQRWNHHRVAKSETQHPFLTDMTDNPFFSYCARCNQANIYETAEKCPACDYYLGPARLSINFRDSLLTRPRRPEAEVGSFITFESTFSSRLGCRIQGDGPTLITLINNESAVLQLPLGRLVESVGNNEFINELLKIGLRPCVGDIVVAVEGLTVLHLNSMQVRNQIVICLFVVFDE
jgi:hypothetical protein